MIFPQNAFPTFCWPTYDPELLKRIYGVGEECRTVNVSCERRSYITSEEVRLIEVGHENRCWITPTEDRSTIIPFENRVVEVL